jgi:hypothetical protein
VGDDDDEEEEAMGFVSVVSVGCSSFSWIRDMFFWNRRNKWFTKKDI